MTVTQERTRVQALAAGLAAQIRDRGHYRNGARGPGGSCLVANQAWHLGSYPGPVRYHPDFPALRDALGVMEIPGRRDLELAALIQLNDSTPTDELLAMLDNIAEGRAA